MRISATSRSSETPKRNVLQSIVPSAVDGVDWRRRLTNLLQYPTDSTVKRFEREVAVDIMSLPVLMGDCYLLCSDGLHGMASSQEILDMLSGCVDVVEAAELLIWLANEGGGRDNVTVVLLQVLGPG